MLNLHKCRLAAIFISWLGTTLAIDSPQVFAQLPEVKANLPIDSGAEEYANAMAGGDQVSFQPLADASDTAAWQADDDVVADTSASSKGLGPFALTDHWSFDPSLLLNYRFLYNEREVKDRGFTTQDDFELRLLRFVGRLSHDEAPLSLMFLLETEYPSNGATIRDLVLDYEFDDSWRLKVGQFRPRFVFEEDVSSMRQLAAERSLVASALGADSGIGAQLSYIDDALAWDVSLVDRSIDISDRLDVPDRLIQAGTRLRYLADGKWKRFRDYASWRDEGFSLQYGAGLLLVDSDVGGRPDEMFVETRGTFDVAAEFGGASLFGALTLSHLDLEDGRDYDRVGLVVQSAVFLTEMLDLFARYEWADSGDGERRLSLLTVGTNTYFARHNAKLTVDAGFAFGPVSRVWDRERAGWFRDRVNDPGQIVLRAQIQFAY